MACKGYNGNKIESNKSDIIIDAKHNFPSMISSKVNGDYYTLCISYNRDVYSFGKSIMGGHGHETPEIIDIPRKIFNLRNIKMIDCGDFHSICLDYDGKVFTFGCNDRGQLGIGKSPDGICYISIPQRVNVPISKQVCCR